MKKSSRMAVSLLLVPLSLCAEVLSAADPAVPTVEEILSYLGFDPAAKRDLLAGKILQSGIPEGDDTELAVTVAMVVPYTLQRVVEAFRSGRILEVDRDVLAFGELRPEPGLEDGMAALTLSPEDRAEIPKLLSAEPGSTFNMTAGEIASFRAVRRRFSSKDPEKDPACVEEVSKCWRRLLLDRARAYQKSGLKAIAAYDRGGGTQSSPGAELRSAGRAAKLLERFPAFYRNFIDYPAGAAPEFEHRFYWIKERVEDRPAFVLSHRTFYQRPDGAIITERQIYVGHSYNSLQIVLGCMPAGERTLVFYTNRTFTDEVAGFATGLRHSMGRKRMLATIVSSFAEMQERADQLSHAGK